MREKVKQKTTDWIYKIRIIYANLGLGFLISSFVIYLFGSIVGLGAKQIELLVVLLGVLFALVFIATYLKYMK